MKFRVVISLAVLLIFPVVPLSGGCSSQNMEGFALYLTRDDISPGELTALSETAIAEEPVVSVNDIISYDARTHELQLTRDAFDRVSDLEVPVQGLTFVVCVDEDPVYRGAFWTMVSSVSFDGITILKPLSAAEPGVIRIERGYPAPSFFRGKDPRNDLEIMTSLRQSGKLLDSRPADFIDVLPHSMKGYELYSWQADGRWYFRLMTGTNRNKTLEEITSPEDIVQGWVSILAVGTESIEVVLGKLPEKESVFWHGGFRTVELQDEIVITLPDEAVVDEIKNYAALCGIDLAVLPAP